ncbi:MAG: TadE/TadG family type IV pilus assembly protein [Methylococcales bacterium]|nr:TadE/TadG family type IV pilus assembly protein [Methylococcales bacterium]
MNLFKQKGSSTVEFAMLLPLLLLLVVMVAELGIRFYQLNTLTKSVQDAARYLSDVSVNKANTATDYANARNLTVYGNAAGTGNPVLSGLTADNITTSNPDANHVQVAATYTSALPGLPSLNAIVNLATGGTAPDIMTLQASSVMRFAQ